MYETLPNYQHKGMEAMLDDKIKSAKIMEVKKGDCILFSSTLFHGNRINTINSV